MRAATVVQVLQDLFYVLLHVLFYLWSLLYFTHVGGDCLLYTQIHVTATSGLVWCVAVAVSTDHRRRRGTGWVTSAMLARRRIPTGT